MVLLLTVFSLTVYILIQRALVNQFDAALLSTAQVLAASIEIDANNIDLEDVQQMPEFNDPELQTYYQIWEQDGTVMARSPLLGTDDLPRLEASFNTVVFKVLNTRDDPPQRAVGLKFLPRSETREQEAHEQAANDKVLTLTVARGAGGLYNQLSLLRWLLFVASGVAIALSVFIASFVVRQGLNPLHSIASEIAAIREDDLATRIGTTSVPAEILPVKNRLNDLLCRLEDAFKRERRFTADVAHELRTPLAGMLSTLEVTLARLRDVNEYQASLSDCLAISRSMQRMVDNLLTLARADAHQITFRRVRIQLAELVNSCWQSFSDRAVEREVVFENRIPAEMTCESDYDSLSMVLLNLLDNAVEYTNQGSQIWAAARQAGELIEITVANTGCKLTSEQVSQVFDCFWRGDSSRTSTGAHSGLGLALVQRLVRALGGSVAAELQPGGIFIICLTLPDSLQI